MNTKRLSIYVIFVTLLFGYTYIKDTADESWEVTVPEKEPATIITEKPITILSTGDVMLGRNVEDLMAIYGNEYPFQEVGEILTAPDLTVINFEGVIAKDHTRTPNGGFTFSFPRSTAHTLSRYGVDLALLGNNHALDYKEAGFMHTKTVLGDVGIETTGHPITISTHEQYVKEIRGTTLHIFSWNETWDTFDLKKAVQAINDVKTKENIVFIYLHWGDEYELTSNKFQRSTARALIRGGADAIIGHHPHVTQEIELYKGKPIFYSLGNFIFDQYFSTDVEEGLLVKTKITKTHLIYELLPIQSTQSVPRLKEGEDRRTFLKNLAQRSRVLNPKAITRGRIAVKR